jgi:hypothetical protein
MYVSHTRTWRGGIMRKRGLKVKYIITKGTKKAVFIIQFTNKCININYFYSFISIVLFPLHVFRSVDHLQTPLKMVYGPKHV